MATEIQTETTRTCSECGQALKPEATYCPMCGKPIDTGHEPQRNMQAKEAAQTMRPATARTCPCATAKGKWSIGIIIVLLILYGIYYACR